MKLTKKVTGKDKVLTIDANQIEGICYAKLESLFSSEDEKLAWLSQEDHFLVDYHAKSLEETNRAGLDLHELQLKHRIRLLSAHEPLKGLELFAGTRSNKV